MKFLRSLAVFLSLAIAVNGQAPPLPADTWTIHADSIDPAHYFGVTVANGMIGLVSSAEPFPRKRHRPQRRL